MSWIADDIAAAHFGPGTRVVQHRGAGPAQRASGRCTRAARRGVSVEIVGWTACSASRRWPTWWPCCRCWGDATANGLVRILTGARWNISPTDLAVLGRRPRTVRRRRGLDELSPREEIARIIDQTQAAGSPSLAEALIDPGEGGYTEAKPGAARRLRPRADRAARSRRRADHRPGPSDHHHHRPGGRAGPARARHQQLDAFVAQVMRLRRHRRRRFAAGPAGYGSPPRRTMASSWSRPCPPRPDSVKLLTIHRAKGLEWEVVYLPALADKVFPSDRVQGNWLTHADVRRPICAGDADNVPQLADMAIRPQGLRRGAEGGGTPTPATGSPTSP